MDEKEQKLRELLENVGEIVPTMLVIGLTEDKHGALLMGSPEENDEKRRMDLCAAIAMMMKQHQALREIIFSAMCWLMQGNPKYRDGMRHALKKLEEIDEHQRTAQPE